MNRQRAPKSVHRVEDFGPVLDRDDMRHGLTASGQERAKADRLRTEQFYAEHPERFKGASMKLQRK